MPTAAVPAPDVVVAQKRRKNGFERPFDVHQVVSWVAFGLLLAAFFGLHTPVRTTPLGIALTVIYAVLATMVVLSAGKCMCVDPRDKGAAPGVTTQRWCSYCEKQVNDRSKHCRKCNKCVQIFDHHCPWLNTCIGLHNYDYFLWLLCSVFALLSLQIASGLQACVESLLDEGAASQLHEIYGEISILAYAILNGASCLLSLCAWLAVLQLLIFHVGLISRGMTTYEFIVAQRQREKRREATRAGPPSNCELCMFEAQNQAPCFAVCKLCDESPDRPRGVISTSRPRALPGRVVSASSEARAPPPSYGRTRPDKYVPRTKAAAMKPWKSRRAEGETAAVRPVEKAAGDAEMMPRSTAASSSTAAVGQAGARSSPALRSQSTGSQLVRASGTSSRATLPAVGESEISGTSELYGIPEPPRGDA